MLPSGPAQGSTAVTAGRMSVSRLRHLVIGGALGALSITALGAPVAAADTQGTLAIVNGVPGKRLDVCINGNEIKSGLRYGQAVLRDTISTGEKVIKFYAQDPRRCKGQLHAQHDGLMLVAGSDFTVVVTKNAPRIVVFNNVSPVYLGEIPPAGPPNPNGFVAFRHASEVLANFFVRYWAPIPETPIDPAAFPLAGKGESFATSTGPDLIWQLRVTRPEDPDTIAFRKLTTQASRRYEWIFVGSNAGNAKIVLLNRRISLPSP
jgi:hypothetical protein